MTTLSVVIPVYSEEEAITEIAQWLPLVKLALARLGIDELDLPLWMKVHPINQ